jgi:hypothetical protein
MPACARCRKSTNVEKVLHRRGLSHFSHVKPQFCGVCQDCVTELVSRTKLYEASIEGYDIKSLRHADDAFKKAKR